MLQNVYLSTFKKKIIFLGFHKIMFKRCTNYPKNKPVSVFILFLSNLFLLYNWLGCTCIILLVLLGPCVDMREKKFKHTSDHSLSWKFTSNSNNTTAFCDCNISLHIDILFIYIAIWGCTSLVSIYIYNHRMGLRHIRSDQFSSSVFGQSTLHYELYTMHFSNAIY